MSELKKTVQDKFKEWADNLKPTQDQDQWAQIKTHETPKTKTRIMPGQSREDQETTVRDLHDGTPLRPGPLENKGRRGRRLP